MFKTNVISNAGIAIGIIFAALHNKLFCFLPTTTVTSRVLVQLQLLAFTGNTQSVHLRRVAGVIPYGR